MTIFQKYIKVRKEKKILEDLSILHYKTSKRDKDKESVLSFLAILSLALFFIPFVLISDNSSSQVIIISGFICIPVAFYHLIKNSILSNVVLAGIITSLLYPIYLLTSILNIFSNIPLVKFVFVVTISFILLVSFIKGGDKLFNNIGSKKKKDALDDKEQLKAKKKDYLRFINSEKIELISVEKAELESYFNNGITKCEYNFHVTPIRTIELHQKMASLLFDVKESKSTLSEIADSISNEKELDEISGLNITTVKKEILESVVKEYTDRITAVDYKEFIEKNITSQVEIENI